MRNLENELIVGLYELAHEASEAGKEDVCEAYLTSLNRIENYFVERKAAEIEEKQQLNALIRLLDRATDCFEEP